MRILIVAAAVATVTMTISASTLSEKARHYIDPYLPKLLKELLDCPYCLSHWIAAGAALTLQNNYVINWLALVALSQIFILPIIWVANANSSQDEPKES